MRRARALRRRGRGRGRARPHAAEEGAHAPQWRLERRLIAQVPRRRWQRRPRRRRRVRGVFHPPRPPPAARARARAQPSLPSTALLATSLLCRPTPPRPRRLRSPRCPACTKNKHAQRHGTKNKQTFKPICFCSQRSAPWRPLSPPPAPRGRRRSVNEPRVIFFLNKPTERRRADGQRPGRDPRGEVRAPEAHQVQN